MKERQKRDTEMKCLTRSDTITEHTDQTWTRIAGTLGNVALSPLFFGGHSFYVAKCVQGDSVNGEFWRRELEGIELPETYSDTQLCVTVLAKGPRVGKPCSKEHAKRHERPICLADAVNVGDTLLCLNRSLGIKRSPICDYEFFIEESVPLCVLREGE